MTKNSNNSAPGAPQDDIASPPGLLGRVREFIYFAAPHPNADIALAGSIALLSGITGKAYNTYTGAGLNQYLLLLASTGMGKEAAASGISKLLTAIMATVPAGGDFKGPALVSSAGLTKWLDKKPSVVSIIGECGYLLNRLSSRRANLNDMMLKQALLDLYSKSSAGSVVDPMAYSDRDKQTGVIISPALTLLGESVPGIVYEALDESMVLSGLLPRFMVIEAKGQRSPFQESPALKPDPALVQSLADLCAQCLTLNAYNNVHVVPADDEAKAKFREFGQWVTDQINAHSSEALKELWNRAHLKALKLASLCAVGINPHAPVVTINETMWATNMVVEQTLRLIEKFDNGETGTEAGNEAKQLRKMRDVIREYVKAETGKYEKSGCTFDMHRDHIFTHKYLFNRLANLPTFKLDRAGASKSIERAIRLLEEAGEIGRVTQPTMMAKYQKASKAYGIHNEGEFMKNGD